MNLQNHGQPDQTIPYQLNQVMVPGYSQPATSAPVLVSYEEILHQQRLQLQQKLQNFWANQNIDIQKSTDFKKRLPLSRLKKAMKADRDVKMISAETPTVIAKACEIFIQELTLRSWCHAEANRRRRLQKSDILSAINGTETFDFLADIVNKDSPKDDICLQAQVPIIDFDPSKSSLLYDMLPPPPPPSKVGTTIDTSAVQRMRVMEPYSGLPYNVAPPRHQNQVGNSQIPVMEPSDGLSYSIPPPQHRPQVCNSAMGTMPVTEFGPSSLPYLYAPQVCDTGMVPGKSVMDLPINVQTSPAGTIGASSLDPSDIHHQFQLQPTYSGEDQHQDLEELMWRMEELDELESTYIERVTLWR